MTTNTDNYHVLTLEEITSWQIPSSKMPLFNSTSTIKARIPSLQREVVWELQQIEILGI